MPLIIADRVLESSTTTGTGVFTLAGASLGFRSFASVCSVADTVWYYIEGVTTSGLPSGEYEYGLGTYSGANQITRTTVRGSSNGGSAVNFSAGTKLVGIAPLAPDSSAAKTEWRTFLGLSLPIAVASGGTGLSAAPPLVMAYQNASGGNIPTGVYTQLPFDTEVVDSGSCFAASVFTPNVAGYYQINCAYAAAPTASMFLAIFRNGVLHKRGHWVQVAGSNAVVSVSALVELNGSTDYLDIRAFQDSGATINAVGGSTVSWLDAHYVRGL